MLPSDKIELESNKISTPICLKSKTHRRLEINLETPMQTNRDYQNLKIGCPINLQIK